MATWLDQFVPVYAGDDQLRRSCRLVGGNSFGVAAPIVTGYVIESTGSYNWAFGIAGLLLVAGATILFTMTRTPIEIAAHPS